MLYAFDDLSTPSNVPTLKELLEAFQSRDAANDLCSVHPYQSVMFPITPQAINARRSNFLLESCEGDSLLLAEVQKSKRHDASFTDENISDSEKILKRGLVVSYQNELECALTMFMELVSSEWHYVQSFDVNGRGGPAPGIGLGWGAAGGGFWSGKVLLAQADAIVTAALLEHFPIVLDKDVFDLEKLILQSDGTDAFVMNTTKKINASLSIVLISGPKDRLITERILNILLTIPVMKFLSMFVHKVLRKETKKSNTINIGDLDQADYDSFSSIIF